MPLSKTFPAATSTQHEIDSLAGWVDHQQRRTRRRSRTAVNPDTSGLRFAFYGRMSIEDFQDQASSHAWQRQAASDLVAGRGRIVVEYLDIGHSRRVAWADRWRSTIAARISTPEHPKENLQKELLVDLATPSRRIMRWAGHGVGGPRSRAISTRG